MNKIVSTLLTLTVFLGISSCEKPNDDDTDPCVDVICLNGGVCDSGTCDCPSGFTGADCGTPIQIVPNYIYFDVTQIEVTRWPSTTFAGDDWDNFGNGKPELYVYFTNDNTTSWDSQFETGTYVVNSIYGQNYSFYPNNSEMNSLYVNDEYTIYLRDYDNDVSPGSGPDAMGDASFTVSNIGGYPNPIVVDYQGSQVAFKVYVNYH
jgi:hypothetical protein